MVSASRVGVTPNDFWGITPSELSIMLEAYYRNIDHEMQVRAYFTSALMNPWVKQRIRPTDLYRPRINNSNEYQQCSRKNLLGAPKSIVSSHYAKKRKDLQNKKNTVK